MVNHTKKVMNMNTSKYIKSPFIIETVMKAIKIIFTVILIVFFYGCGGNDVKPEPTKPKLPELNWPKAKVTGSIFQSGRGMSLFENRTARNVGDIVTIVLKEQTQASKQANSSVSKDTAHDISASALFGKTNIGSGLGTTVSGTKEFDGKGSADQSSNITGEIACFVTDVMPNGNLVIAGKKKITLNRGDEYIIVSGVVRPDDIGDNNSILSTKVAAAEIAYTGKGEIAESNVMGWLSRFFMSPLWPF